MICAEIIEPRPQQAFLSGRCRQQEPEIRVDFFFFGLNVDGNQMGLHAGRQLDLFTPR